MLTAAGADALAYSRALELEPHSASSSTRQGSLLGGVLGLSEIKSVARFCRRLLDERLQTATGAFLNPTEYDDGAQLAGRENVAALGT